jgi:hypothetical protein
MVAVVGGVLALGCSDNDAAPDGGGGAGADGSAGTVDSGTPAMSFTFESGMDGFALDTFANAGPYVDGNPQNIGGVPNGAGPPAVTFDGADGMPSQGSAHITATFNDFNQTVTVRRIYQPTDTIALNGRTITAQIKLDAGAGFTGIVHLMALSSPSPPNPGPGYYFAQGDSIRLTDNDWHTLRFQMSAPEFAATGWNPGDTVQIGVQIGSGLPAAPAGDGGVDGGVVGSTYGAPQAISIHFDTMAWN